MSTSQYISYPISKLHHSIALPGSLYIFVGGRFVKLIHAEDELPAEKFDSFILKNIQFVFILSDELDAFKNWYLTVKESSKTAEVKVIGEENSKIVDLYAEARDEFLCFITSDITDEGVAVMVAKTKRIAQEVLSTLVVAEMVTKMQKLSGSLVDHATNVANIAMFVGVNSGYSHQLLLENLYLGGLFHDYGKIKIDQKLQENPDSEDYKKALKEHPMAGRMALMAETGFGDEVLDIIGQHHENFDGSGYPRGLKGSKIYELTKIISLSNAFDNLVRAGSGQLKERQIKALEELQKDDREKFDPRVLQKFVKCMDHVIRN